MMLSLRWLIEGLESENGKWKWKWKNQQMQFIIGIRMFGLFSLGRDTDVIVWIQCYRYLRLVSLLYFMKINMMGGWVHTE